MKNISENIIKCKELYSKWKLEESEKLLILISKTKNISEIEPDLFYKALYLLTNIYVEKKKWNDVLRYSKLLLNYKNYKKFEVLYNIMISYYYLDDDLYKKYLFLLEKINSSKIKNFKEKINSESEIIYDQLLVDKDWRSKLIIVLMLTLKCNQKCVFCNVNKWNTFIPIEKIERNLLMVLEKYKGIKNKIIQVAISWWEPTIHPDFWKIVDMTYNYADFFEIQSNWVLFAREDNHNELLKRNSYMKLNFLLSFHSHIEEIYDKITDTKKQYNLAVRWIQNVINSWINNKVEINIVINKYNINYFWDYLKFIKDNIYSFNKRRVNLNLMVSILKVEREDERKHYELIVSYSNFIDIFIDNLNYIRNNNFEWLLDMQWWICDLPICTISNKGIFNINEWFLLNNTPITHTKMDKCKDCRLNSKCPWILKSYINKFWENEFNPL